MNIIKKKYSEFLGVKTVAILADPACRTSWVNNTPALLERVWREHRPELFLVAGDLAVKGTSGEYGAFISALGSYSAQLAAVPGDHDRPLSTFMNHFGSTRKVIDIGRWRFIAVNTANKVFTKSEASFLENHLRPNTIILSHTPPGISGWTFHSLRPVYSNRFLSIIDRHRSKIRAAFFGHIHGYSRREHSGVPLFVAGGVAESWTIGNNGYAEPGSSQIMLFNTRTGKITPCRMD